jgi:chaperonin GroEL
MISYKELSDFDKEKLKERLAKLTKGVAVIKVGGETEIEMKERKERAIDAVAATQSAVKYGIVPGGEIVYLMVANCLDKSNLGEKILYDALFAPFKKLVTNAGFDGGQMLSEFEHKEGKLGLDVTDGVWKDMVEAKIVDPTEVSTTAIKTAVSVAVALLSVGVAIVPEEKDEKK